MMVRLSQAQDGVATRSSRRSRIRGSAIRAAIAAGVVALVVAGAALMLVVDTVRRWGFPLRRPPGFRAPPS
jgi:hypothetical protein